LFKRKGFMFSVLVKYLWKFAWSFEMTYTVRLK